MKTHRNVWYLMQRSVQSCVEECRYRGNRHVRLVVPFIVKETPYPDSVDMCVRYTNYGYGRDLAKVERAFRRAVRERVRQHGIIPHVVFSEVGGDYGRETKD